MKLLNYKKISTLLVFCALLFSQAHASVQYDIDESELNARFVANDIAASSNFELERLKNTVESNFNKLWYPSNAGVTPQMIFNSYGETACKVLIASQKTQAFIKDLDPSYETLSSPYNLTANQDCTVLVGDLK